MMLWQKGGRPAAGAVQTLIGEGSSVRGSIRSTGTMRIDGTLEGTIEHDGELIVGPTGRIRANVQARSLTIAGEVQGTIQVEGRLAILSSGKLYGDIRCGHLVIEEGAIFQGRSQMPAAGEPPAPAGGASELPAASA